MFVAIEGIDGAGTSTQCTRVAAALKAQLQAHVHTTREPSDNPIGKVIRAALSAADKRFDEPTMALLFAADRLNHIRNEVQPALQDGAYVLSDRYVMSSLAYQAELLGLPPDGGWIAEINRKARHADLTVLVDVDAGVALQRRIARGGPAERYDDQALQERLVLRYRALATQLPSCICVDGSLPVEQVTAAIVKQIITHSRKS